MAQSTSLLFGSGAAATTSETKETEKASIVSSEPKAPTFTFGNGAQSATSGKNVLLIHYERNQQMQFSF